MNGYNFTDRVRKVLQMAREEAARLHHEYVGTEHILLGLIREGEGVAAAVLTNLSVDLDEIQLAKAFSGPIIRDKCRRLFPRVLNERLLEPIIAHVCVLGNDDLKSFTLFCAKPVEHLK